MDVGKPSAFVADTCAKARITEIIDRSWNLLFQRIIHGRVEINKEASMQLQLAKIMQELGTAYCVLPNEVFQIELETNYDKQSIDITCGLGEATGALELKCFKKDSNRAKDLDMYDALKDIQRLETYNGFDVKSFICLTDNKYYAEYTPKGYASTVKTTHGTQYLGKQEIVPGWKGKWKVNRNASIMFQHDVTCNWVKNGNWFYWKHDID